MSDMSHLIFSLIYLFLDSQSYSEKPNFLMFVIFLLTRPSAIFASCGLLVQSHSFPNTAIAPSCCPLPPLSLPPPPPAPPPPLTTIEAAHRQCALPHPTPQQPSGATVHSCCVPSPPAPPLLSSTIEAAHRWCALLQLTLQPPTAATVHSCCVPSAPPPPLPLSHSCRPLPPSTVAVRRCHRHCRCHHPYPLLSQCNVCCSWYIIKNR